MSCSVQITQFFKNRKEWPIKTTLWSLFLFGYFKKNISPLILLHLDMHFQSCKQRHPKKGNFVSEKVKVISTTRSHLHSGRKSNLVNVKFHKSVCGFINHFRFKLSQIWNP